MLKYVAIFALLMTLAACQSQRMTMTETRIPQDTVPSTVVQEVNALELLDLPAQENEFATEVQTQNELIVTPRVDSKMSVDSDMTEPVAK